MAFDPKSLINYSTGPGVYLMKDKKGKVVYVGKAKNLRARIKQYFSNGSDTREMIPYLIAKLHSIDTIVVSSEKEALLLENNLIKKHQPKYNALLKDDKTYIALKISRKEEWPAIHLVRYRGKPKEDGEYFGPYTSAHSARELLDLMNRIFPLRQCSDQELKRRTRPCILYDMKRCIAPCVLRCTKDEYKNVVNEAALFLRGDKQRMLKHLKQQMEEASDKLNFEKAQDCLNKIRAIEKIVEKQSVDRPHGLDIDALGIYREGEEVVLGQALIRGGKLLSVQHFNFSNIAEDDEGLLTSFMTQFYTTKSSLPDEILLPIPISHREGLEAIFSEKKKTAVKTPVRGEKVNLVKIAESNAKDLFRREKDKKVLTEKTLMEMREKFTLNRFPELIECIDNSNLFGDEPVSSIVAFKEGKKEKSRYRRYAIKAALRSDDYGMMIEVLNRRLTKLKEEDDLPDLLIVDGGKGHLNVALRVLKDLNIITVDVIAVTKEQGRHDKGMTNERVFLPNVKEPVLLPSNSNILFLLQRIRDEAHRFAIDYQKTRRSKKQVKSELDGVEGIGPKKKQALIRYFGSLKRVKEARLKELSEAPKISKADAKRIRNHFDTQL